MLEANSIKLSVITATYNSAGKLPGLVQSLANQSDSNFEWIVADGGSSDETLQILTEATRHFKGLLVESRIDFGIYDAINRGLLRCSSDYYLVVGSDDLLHPHTIRNYKKSISESSPDFVTAKITSAGRTSQPRGAHLRWLYGQFAYVNGHSVGLLIRKSIHEKVGYYSTKFPIAADQLFILSAIDEGFNVKQESFIAGEFNGLTGTSGSDLLGCLTESYRVQVLTGQSLFVQTLLFFARLTRNFNKINRRSRLFSP